MIFGKFTPNSTQNTQKIQAPCSVFRTLHAENLNFSKRPNRLKKPRPPRLFGACSHIALGFIKDFRVRYVAAIDGVILPDVIGTNHP